MAVNVEEKIKKLSPARRKKVVSRAAELLAEEMTLRLWHPANSFTYLSRCFALILW